MGTAATPHLLSPTGAVACSQYSTVMPRPVLATTIWFCNPVCGKPRPLPVTLLPESLRVVSIQDHSVSYRQGTDLARFSQHPSVLTRHTLPSTLNSPAEAGLLFQQRLFSIESRHFASPSLHSLCECAPFSSHPHGDFPSLNLT